MRFLNQIISFFFLIFNSFMVLEIKAVSDTNLHQHESISSLSHFELMSSANSKHILLNKRVSNFLIQNPLESTNDIYQRFSNDNLLHAHFPILSMKESKFSVLKLIPFTAMKIR